jgi:hypothetical protein
MPEINKARNALFLAAASSRCRHVLHVGVERKELWIDQTKNILAMERKARHFVFVHRKWKHTEPEQLHYEAIGSHRRATD